MFIPDSRVCTFFQNSALAMYNLYSDLSKTPTPPEL